jgi:hypothetical protein
MLKKLGRVAIVADQMTAFGGADREMLSVLKLVPEADIYTVLYNPNGYENVEIKQKIYTSFVQKLPLKFKFSKHLKVLNPIAYENFDLRGYDTIISMPSKRCNTRHRSKTYCYGNDSTTFSLGS